MTSAATSPATTGPERPASAVNDALPRVVAVFSRNREAFGSFGRSEMIGIEALVRWEHPDLGLLEPAAFLDIAEETGLIVPIGAWVLHEACSQTARWCAELPQQSPLSIAVNLSARQLNDPELVSIVDSVLAATRLDP